MNKTRMKGELSGLRIKEEAVEWRDKRSSVCSWISNQAN